MKKISFKLNYKNFSKNLIEKYKIKNNLFNLKNHKNINDGLN